MIPAIIGIAIGILAILLATTVAKANQQMMYALILAAIGFLYVGFTWSDLLQLTITIIQALVFLMLAYYGAIKNVILLTIGYFAHGVWDLLYTNFVSADLMPPHYDIFCLSVDFIMGAYLLFFKPLNARLSI